MAGDIEFGHDLDAVTLGESDEPAQVRLRVKGLAGAVALRPGLRFEAPRLIVDEVEVQHVQLVGRHDPDRPADEVQVEERPDRVEHESAPRPVRPVRDRPAADGRAGRSWLDALDERLRAPEQAAGVGGDDLRRPADLKPVGFGLSGEGAGIEGEGDRPLRTASLVRLDDRPDPREFEEPLAEDIGDLGRSRRGPGRNDNPQTRAEPEPAPLMARRGRKGDEGRARGGDSHHDQDPHGSQAEHHAMGRPTRWLAETSVHEAVRSGLRFGVPTADRSINHGPKACQAHPGGQLSSGGFSGIIRARLHDLGHSDSPETAHPRIPGPA